MQGQPIFVFSRHESSVSALCSWRNEDHNLDCVISGDYEGRVLIWHIDSGNILLDERFGSQKIISLETLDSLNFTTLLIQSRDGFIDVHKICYADSSVVWLERRTRIECSNCTFCGFAVHSIGSNQALIASIDSSSTLSLSLDWIISCQDVKKGRKIDHPKELGMITSIRMVSLNQNEQNRFCFLIGFEVSTMHVHHIQVEDDKISEIGSLSLEIDTLESLAAITCIDAFQINKNILKVFCGSIEDQLFQIELLVSTEKLQLIAKKKVILTNKGLASLRVRPGDQKLVATGGCDANVRLFSAKTLKKLAVLSFHSKTVETICFVKINSKSAQLLLAGSVDNLITVWDVYN